MTTTLGSVNTTIDNHIATITFEHPAHNSLPGKLLQQLQGAITHAGEDDSVRVVVLQSGGDRTFCAGASFDELQAIDDFMQGKRFFMGFAKVINAIRKCPKFVIGRVQGKAVGGGVGLAAATDYCLATKYASVKLSELAIGIGPFVIGPAVERKIGTAAFSQLAIHATDWQTAAWAKTQGLFADVFETTEELDKAVAQLAQNLATSSPEAMQELKKVLWQGTENWDTLLEERAAQSGRLVLSDYTRQSIAAFKKK